VAAVYTFTIAAGTGAQDPMHPGTGKTVQVLRGTKVRMRNSDTEQHVSHGGGGFAHEADAGGQANATYEINTTGIAPGANATFGCHTHGAATYATVQVR